MTPCSGPGRPAGRPGLEAHLLLAAGVWLGHCQAADSEAQAYSLAGLCGIRARQAGPGQDSEVEVCQWAAPAL